jgi:hypothetical protein
MSDPLEDDAAIAMGHLVALYFADARAKHRKVRQRVALLAADDPRRTRGMCRFVVTDTPADDA